MAAATSVARNKDGVPTWDGTPDSFEEYSEQCLIYEQSTPFHKRCLVGPRLLGELQGAAKRHVAGQAATWLSNDRGVDTLLRHLRACLGKPQIPELTEYLNRYFRQGRRKQHESMNEYIARKCELYLRACQAMARVAPYHQGSDKEDAKSSGSGGASVADQWNGYYSWPERSRRSSWDSQTTNDDGEGSHSGTGAGSSASAQQHQWSKRGYRQRGGNAADRHRYMVLGRISVVAVAELVLEQLELRELRATTMVAGRGNRT